jgi:hypothetical protein
MKSADKIVKDILSKSRDDDEYGIKYAIPSSQPFVCKQCGAQFESRGELFEHKNLMHKRID